MTGDHERARVQDRAPRLGHARAVADGATNALATAAALPYLAKDKDAVNALAGLSRKLVDEVQTPVARLSDRAQQWRRAATNGVAESRAALDELHQLFIPGRSAEVSDWLSDTLGASLGLYVGRRLMISRLGRWLR